MGTAGTSSITSLNVLSFFFVAILCVDPGVPEHGRRVGEQFAFGDSVSYSCVNGYRLTGSSELMCTSAGTWSAALPLCVGKKSSYVQPQFTALRRSDALPFGFFRVNELVLSSK